MPLIGREFIKSFPSTENITDNLRRCENTAVFGVSKHQKPFIASGFDEFVLYIAADFVSAAETVEELNAYGGNFVYLPPKEEVLFSKRMMSSAYAAQRAAALFRMQSGIGGVVTTIEAMLQLYPKADSFRSCTLILSKDESHDLPDIATALTAMGYRFDEELPHEGTFTRRGDILDIFPPNMPNPVRIEFFGDLIEDIRFIDRETKRSAGKINEAAIIPVRNLFNSDFDADELIKNIESSCKKQKLDADAAVRLKTVCGENIAEIQSGNADGIWLLPFVKHSYLTEYLPENCVVIWDEPKQLGDRKNLLAAEHASRVAYLLEKGEILPQHEKQMLRSSALPLLLEGQKQLAFQSIAAVSDLFSPKQIVQLKSSPVSNYRMDMEMLTHDLGDWEFNGYRVLIAAGDSDACERIQKEIDRLGRRVVIADTVYKSMCAIIPSYIKHGFVSHDEKLAIIGCDDIFTKRKTKAKLRKQGKSVFVAPEVGDYVVHELHGIGLCEGIVTLTGSFGMKDFILVKYHGEDKLYVPVDSANLLARYSGSDRVPKLSRLGGNEFEKIKARVKNNIKEMAIDLAALYAERENARGFVYNGDLYLEDMFAEAFPYEETLDQLKCINDVCSDLGADKIMDRLLCGDVGYGKTEVALRAAFKVILSGKQVAFLSPTTILSEQHFQTAVKRFKEFGVRIACLNRFRTKKEQAEILQEMQSGKVQLVCGTHRLLSKDVKFADLGLLVLDEEQRFGVEAKETIKTWKKNIDVLTLSATPIPRTLHMALTGMRDISVIQTPPKERLPVETSVLEGNENLIRDIILRETGRGGQVFLIYNRVETIEAFTSNLRKLVPQARFVVAHGQMDENTLENSIYGFIKGLGDVLVSSTIIENGIDIPNANTLIVYDADNFGLSQLYQLRGRVGRGKRLAYAYFMYRENKILSETAYKRLSSILEYTELGSGFKIAVRDLEIRGAGDVLGKQQHGHMEKVGYDMYCKLLAESMNEIKGTPQVKAADVVLDIALDASASDYITDSESRIAFYQRLADVTSLADIAELQEEIRDIYGAPPQETKNLLEIAALKVFAAAAGLSEICVKKDGAKICFRNVDALKQPQVFSALERTKGITRLDISKTLQVAFDLKVNGVKAYFDAVKAFVTMLTDK